MLNKYTSKFITNMVVLAVSCIVFLVFFLNLYHNSQTEQTYEITDHTISKKAIINDNSKNVKEKNAEQNDYKVFALVE